MLNTVTVRTDSIDFGLLRLSIIAHGIILNVHGYKGRERLKKIWMDYVKKDMRKGVNTADRDVWKRST